MFSHLWNYFSPGRRVRQAKEEVIRELQKTDEKLHDSPTDSVVRMASELASDTKEFHPRKQDRRSGADRRKSANGT